MGPAAYEHTNAKGQNYFLHSKTITLKGNGKTQTIYFFAREIRSEGAVANLPEGWMVVESQRTGLPILKKA